MRHCTYLAQHELESVIIIIAVVLIAALESASCVPAVPPPGSIQYEPHALDSAPSPLLQTLPNYERQFRYHLQKAQAHLEVSQQREAICRQLLSEQEVQAMSIDAARMNVEHHYQYIARAFEEFMVT